MYLTNGVDVLAGSPVFQIRKADKAAGKVAHGLKDLRPFQKLEPEGALPCRSAVQGLGAHDGSCGNLRLELVHKFRLSGDGGLDGSGGVALLQELPAAGGLLPNLVGSAGRQVLQGDLLPGLEGEVKGAAADRGAVGIAEEDCRQNQLFPGISCGEGILVLIGYGIAVVHAPAHKVVVIAVEAVFRELDLRPRLVEPGGHGAAAARRGAEDHSVFVCLAPDGIERDGLIRICLNIVHKLAVEIVQDLPLRGQRPAQEGRAAFPEGADRKRKRLALHNIQIVHISLAAVGVKGDIVVEGIVRISLPHPNSRKGGIVGVTEIGLGAGGTGIIQFLPGAGGQSRRCIFPIKAKVRSQPDQCKTTTSAKHIAESGITDAGCIFDIAHIKTSQVNRCQRAAGIKHGVHHDGAAGVPMAEIDRF